MTLPHKPSFPLVSPCFSREILFLTDTVFPRVALRFAQPQRSLRLWGLTALWIRGTLPRIQQLFFLLRRWMGNAP
jgi:hypothetical protein